MKEIKDVIRDVKKQGGQEILNVVVKNINVTEMRNYDRVTLTVNKDIPRFITDDNGASVESTSRTVFASSYSLGAVLSENESTAFVKNYILDNPELLTLLMSYADVDLLLERVHENDEYINPFSNATEGNIINNDQWFVHVTRIDFGEQGMEFLAEMKKELMSMMLKDALSKKGQRRARRTTRTVTTVEEEIDDTDDSAEEEVVETPKKSSKK